MSYKTLKLRSSCLIDGLKKELGHEIHNWKQLYVDCVDRPLNRLSQDVDNDLDRIFMKLCISREARLIENGFKFTYPDILSCLGAYLNKISSANIESFDTIESPLNSWKYMVALIETFVDKFKMLKESYQLLEIRRPQVFSQSVVDFLDQKISDIKNQSEIDSFRKSFKKTALLCFFNLVEKSLKKSQLSKKDFDAAIECMELLQEDDENLENYRTVIHLTCNRFAETLQTVYLCGNLEADYNSNKLDDIHEIGKRLYTLLNSEVGLLESINVEHHFMAGWRSFLGRSSHWGTDKTIALNLRWYWKEALILKLKQPCMLSLNITVNNLDVNTKETLVNQLKQVQDDTNFINEMSEIFHELKNSA